MRFPALQRQKWTTLFFEYLRSFLPKKPWQWHEGLLKTIKSLSEMPKRCPLARENKYFSQEIRQLLYGRGRNTHRILFTVIEEIEVPTVRILHFRYRTQQVFGESQESDET